MRHLIVVLLLLALSPLVGFAQGDLRHPDKTMLKQIQATKTLTIDGRTYPIEIGEAISSEPGTRYYLADKGTYYAGVFAVHIPEAYAKDAPLPLVVSSHGNGGNGIGEMGGWAGAAERYGFIAVCPSFGVACMASPLGTDEKMLGQIMGRVFASLKVDRSHVLGTGFSGGGLAAYGIMMKHPEWFTALAFRGANIRGALASRSAWKRRPIYILWGENDHPLIYNKAGGGGDGPTALDALLKMKSLSAEYKRRPNDTSFDSADGTFKWEQVKGAGHESQSGRVANWFAEKVVKK
jgi:hypothetical protein